MKSAAETLEASRALVRFVESRRWPLSDEKRLQAEIQREFAAASITAEREVNLGDADIIDFVVEDVGIEIKIRGVKRQIYRQCERYCGHERIAALVLVSNVAMGMPASINGKPILIASLAKGWL